MRRIVFRSGWGLLVLVLAACVTINVYFPAAAVERAADRIIEDVWGQRPQDRDDAPEESGAGAAEPEPVSPEPFAVEFIARALWIVVPAANAQQADINVSTPEIERLKRSLSARFGQLRPYYDSGAVGLTGDGLVTLRSLDNVPLNQRNRVQQLVQQENQDRRALYRAIARANGHPEWEDDIRDVFAQRWIGNARSGWWYQSGGRWRQK